MGNELITAGVRSNEECRERTHLVIVMKDAQQESLRKEKQKMYYIISVSRSAKV